MTTETMPASGVAAEEVTPVETAQTTPEVAEPESNDEPQAPQEESKDDSEHRRTQRRIDRLTKARYQAQAEAQQLRAQLEQLRQAQQPADEEPPQIKPEDIERIALERAEQIAAGKALQSKVDSVLSAGQKIKDFDSLCNTVNEEVSFYENGKPSQFLEAVLDSDKPHELLAYLGRNPDLAADLQGLSPAQLGRKLAAIEAEMSKPKEPQPSKAPKPLQPVKSGGGGSGEPDPKDTAAWIAWRNRQPRR